MKERNYGIDLLRLVLMFMVCMVHILDFGGGFFSVEAGTATYYIFWLLEVVCYCAVDGFAIISGYVASEKKHKYSKLVSMWFQVFFYSFILTGIFVLLGVKTDWSRDEIIRALFPVMTGYYWYFTGFFALYFAMPMLNKFFFAMEKTTAQKALILLFLLYSCMEVFFHTFATQGGYSAIWLMVLYSIGLLAKRAELFQRKSTGVLILMWAACVLFTWWTKAFAGKWRLISYVSPTIVLSGLLLVILFSRLRLKGSLVAKLSPLAFGIYLFQTNDVIWNTYLQNTLAFAGTRSTAVAVLWVLAGGLAIFACGLLLEYCRSILAKALRIPHFSQKTASAFGYALDKLTCFLN